MTKQQQAILLFNCIGLLLLSVFDNQLIIDFCKRYEILMILSGVMIFVISCYCNYNAYYKKLVRHQEDSILEIDKKMNLFYHDFWMIFIIGAFVGVVYLGIAFTITGFCISFISLSVLFNKVVLKDKILLKDKGLVYSDLSLFSEIHLDGENEIVIDEYKGEILFYKGRRKLKIISNKIMSRENWILLKEQLSPK